jgi:hypothetical protein
MPTLYSYRQNNSGGYFRKDLPLAITVLADDKTEADAWFESAGGYFGLRSGDCSCCGARYWDAWGDDCADDPQGVEEFDSTLMLWRHEGGFVRFVTGHGVWWDMVPNVK